jgi:hypothetical protein
LPSLGANWKGQFIVATRNERKRAAKAANAAIMAEIERLQAEQSERNRQRDAMRERLAEYPIETRHSPNRTLFDRSGIIQRGALVRRTPEPNPLVHDGNESGRGQLRKKMVG